MRKCNGNDNGGRASIRLCVPRGSPKLDLSLSQGDPSGDHLGTYKLCKALKYRFSHPKIK